MIAEDNSIAAIIADIYNLVVLGGIVIIVALSFNKRVV
jgi:hypothetical protein